MNPHVDADFIEMEKKLKCYVDKGRVAGGTEVRLDPMVSVKPDASLIKPLKRTPSSTGSFIAVDCSTRTLKRAQQLGHIPNARLMRSS
jgi:hypothetical protein